jgi:hypothetical protein
MEKKDYKMVGKNYKIKKNKKGYKDENRSL